MKNLLYFISILFFFLITNNISAQDINENSWMCSFNFNPSILLSNNNWSLKHPVYQATGKIQYEEINGIFEQSIFVSGGLEVKKGHFAFQGNIGFIPQKLTKNMPVKDKELNLLFSELSILFYPMKYNGSPFNPFISIGGALLKASGDIDNTGLMISYTGGVKIPLYSKIGFNLGLKGMLLRYTQLQLSENISKDISIYPFALFIGAFYQF